MQIKSKERVKNRGEVFTNKKEIVEMIDLLKDKDLSKNILEPACGTGNFLVEILKEKLKIQDEYEAISSLFGTDICSENIETSRKRLKEMLKTKESKNKVDENIFVKNFLELESINGINAKDLFYLIITNPPYQTNTTGHANQATPLYDKFFFKAKSLNPEYISFIIPSRWFSGGWGLDDFREEMKKGNISYLKNYVNSKIPFPENEIKGGICYFLWERNFDGDTLFVNIDHTGRQSTRYTDLSKFDIIIKDEISEGILNKIRWTKSFYEHVKGLNHFGIATNYSDNKGTIDVYLKYKGRSKIDIVKNIEDVNKFKIVISKASEGHGYPGKIISNPLILKPNEVCSMSYLVVFLGTEADCLKYKNFLESKTVRFLISLRKNTQDISKDKFRFVPGEIELLDTLKLTKEELEYIDSIILDF